MLARNDQLLTSAITLGEILVKPMQNHDAKAVAYYQKLIATTAVVVPFEEKQLWHTHDCEWTARCGSTPIQLACAATRE